MEAGRSVRAIAESGIVDGQEAILFTDDRVFDGVVDRRGTASGRHALVLRGERR